MKNRDDEALFKYSIIAPYINGTSSCDSVREFALLASEKAYVFNGETVKYDFETIRKWIKNYNTDGFKALYRKQRNDYQSFRVLGEDIEIRIIDFKTKFPKARASVVYDKIKEEGYFEEGDISLRTFQRFFKAQDFKKPEARERKVFAFKNSNDFWQADTIDGPYIIIKGVKYKTYIQTIIDDHSRFVVGSRAVFHDDALNFQDTLKKAISAYGIPRILYVDRGGPYDNKQLSIICARLGIANRHAPVRDGASKGKIEKAQQFLEGILVDVTDWSKYENIDDLNKDLDDSINKYNSKVHSVTKQKPCDMFFKDLEDKREIDDQKLKESFYHTEERKVTKVATVSINKIKYEVDYSLRNKKLDFTFDPRDKSCIYHNGKKYFPVDYEANAHKKRKVNVDFSKAANLIDGSEKEYDQDK